MEADNTLHDLTEKFSSYLRAGIDARMLVECHAGKLIVSLNIQLNSTHSQKKVSPSRLRRRARRQEKRDKYAAENAATENSKVSSSNDVQEITEVVNDESQSNAVNFVDSALHAAKAVPVQQIMPSSNKKKEPLLPNSAENVVLSPQPHKDFTLLDRSSDQSKPDHRQIDDRWPCYCCKIQKLFFGEERLRAHHDAHHQRFQDCDWCYPYHIWIKRT